MADHPRSSEQQEADAAASRGCGMFDFLKKKPEDVHSSENAGVTNESKDEEKPSLADRLHLSDSSSSDEEAGGNGRKKEKKKKKKKKKKEDHAADQCETEEKKGIMEKMKEKLPAGIGHDQAKAEHGDGNEKGFMEKMKEKLPGGHHGKYEPELHDENGKKKGFMDKIKEKLPGHTNDEKNKET